MVVVVVSNLDMSGYLVCRANSGVCAVYQSNVPAQTAGDTRHKIVFTVFEYIIISFGIFKKCFSSRNEDGIRVRISSITSTKLVELP